jgi:hypothetical protein
MTSPQPRRMASMVWADPESRPHRAEALRCLLLAWAWQVVAQDCATRNGERALPVTAKSPDALKVEFADVWEDVEPSK